MQPAASLLLLVFSLLGILAHVAAGAPVSFAKHTRQLQSSCDTSSFPELKPVSVGCLGHSCRFLVFTSHRDSFATRTACRHSLIRRQQEWSGRE